MLAGSVHGNGDLVDGLRCWLGLSTEMGIWWTDFDVGWVCPRNWGFGGRTLMLAMSVHGIGDLVDGL